MAHLTFSEIKDSLIGESQHLAALVDAIQKCETARDAKYIVEHIECVTESLCDCTSMIDNIAHGRRDEYGDTEDAREIFTPCEPPKFAPEWALVKRTEGTAEPIPLSDDDLFVGCCPKCGKPVTLTAYEFYGIIGDEDNDGLDTGVYCDECHEERKEESDSDQQDNFLQTLNGISADIGEILEVGASAEHLEKLKSRIDDRIMELMGAEDEDAF